MAMFRMMTPAVVMNRSRPTGILMATFLAASLCVSGTESRLQAGSVRTLAGTGVKGTAQDGSPAASSAIGEPYGLTVGPDGALYVCEIASHLVRRIDLKAGTLSRMAGSGRLGYSGSGGPARDALLNEPYEVRFDSQGRMLFVDMKNAVIERVNLKSGTLQTIAGTGKPGFSGDQGPAISAQFKQPHSIALDEADNILVCDIGNGRIRRIDAESGIVTTLAGGGNRPLSGEVSPLADIKLSGPRALCFWKPGMLALALREGNAIYWLNVNQGTLTHLAGTGKKGYQGDGGDGRQALLSGPKGVAVDQNGDIYFADTESHTIRVVRHASGIVETVVGDGTRGDGPDGPAHACRLARPHGVCLDQNGNLYIGDSENHRVRTINIRQAD